MAWYFTLPNDPSIAVTLKNVSTQYWKWQTRSIGFKLRAAAKEVYNVNISSSRSFPFNLHVLKVIHFNWNLHNLMW